jgi:hypothetical protein
VNVGWFPLGPREVFAPSYPVSRTYINNVNISNTTVNQTVINNYYNTTVVNKNVTVNNVKYVNQSVPGAVTATSPHAFTSAQPVARNMVAVNQHEVVAAPVAVHAPSVVPPKQAVLGAGVATNSHPPTALQNRAVVAKTAPPPPAPSFEVRQKAIQENQGRPISLAQARQLQQTQTHATAAPVKIAPPAQQRAPQISNLQQRERGNSEPGALNANRPPSNTSSAGASRPNQPNQPVNTKAYADRPPASRPSYMPNPQLEQKHEQQNQQLQQKQDQQYQKLQQKQQQEQQKLQQQQADEQRQQQVQQEHQQQLQDMAQKHQQEQQSLKQKQDVEHAKAADKPPKSQPHEEKHK